MDPASEARMADVETAATARAEAMAVARHVTLSRRNGVSLAIFQASDEL
jgi:hypothetical protein